MRKRGFIKHAKIYVSQQLCYKTPSIHGRRAADIQDGQGADTPNGREAAGTPDGRGATDTTIGREAADTGISRLFSTMSDSMMSVRVICGERRCPSYQIVLMINDRINK